MAGLVLVGVLTAYNKIEETIEKRKAKKAANAAPFSDLEPSTSARTAPRYSEYMNTETRGNVVPSNVQANGEVGSSNVPTGGMRGNEALENERPPPNYEDLVREGMVPKKTKRSRFVWRREREKVSGGDGVIR